VHTEPVRAGLLGRLASAIPNYLELAWWGLASPRLIEREPLMVYQGVVLQDHRVALAVRHDLRGWELPGGNGNRGESPESAVVREVREETGLDVRVECHVGDYIRTGFRPHTARVFTCRVIGGRLRPSHETPVVRWFDVGQMPTTLFPWYRAPIDDALDSIDVPRERHEHQGMGSIWAGLSIDLRMRVSADTAGLPISQQDQQKGPST
jgi:8-oxo-dGTP pyrophosphatase MutT (NUDIX family)